MNGNRLPGLTNEGVDYSRAVALYQDSQHQIYWVGVHTGGEEIECNAYLLVDGGEGYLIEAGGYDRFTPVLDKVNEVCSASAITHLLFSHQDPDVCASLPSWMEFNKDLKVIVPALWIRFLPHYMAYNVSYLAVADEGATLNLRSGGALRCISAPYLHSPGNMVLFDTVSGFLFSGDIGAAVYKDDRPRLVIDDWEAHVKAMQGFHQRYLGSNRAVAGFLEKLTGLSIQAIVPQHGAIFRGEEVGRYLHWLSQLPVGVDYLYPTVQ